MTELRIADDLWQDGEAAISAWFYEDGDTVRAGDVIAELMVEKSSFELRAPADGRLTILAQAEEPVIKGQTVARIA